MKSRIVALKEYVLSSFWFLPCCIILWAIILSQINLYLDARFPLNKVFQLDGWVDWYRTILSVISSSMMTITWVVFSMTLVALSLAAWQFWSRVIRNFMKNKLNQIVLGSYLACFSYCLLVLRKVKGEEYLDYIPHFSIFFALIFALINIILLIIFIHHISRSIQSEVIVEDIYKELLENILKMPKLNRNNQNDISESQVRIQLSKYSFWAETAFEDDWYIEYINIEKLQSIANDNEMVFWIQKWYWDYVTRLSSCVKIYSNKEIAIEDIECIRSCITLWNRRIPEYDIRYSYWQLIQIAVRALSPGINDPFTAISCIDKLWSAMSELSHRKFPEKFYSKKQQIRVIYTSPNYQDILELAFDQIKHYAHSSPKVLEQLMMAYVSLLRQDLRDERRIFIESKIEALKKFTQDSMSVWDDIDKVLSASKNTTLFSS